MRANRLLSTLVLLLAVIGLVSCGGGSGTPSLSEDTGMPVANNPGGSSDEQNPGQGGSASMEIYGPVAGSLAVVDQSPFGVPIPAFPSDELDRQIS